MKAVTALDLLIRKLPEYLSAIFITAVWIFVILSIIGRFALGFSTAGPTELSRLGLVWSVFLGASVGISRGSHTALDVVSRRLPPLLKKFLDMIIRLLISAVAVVMIWKGWELIVRTAGRTSTTVLGFEQNIFYWPLVISGILILLNVAWLFWEDYFARPGEEN